MLPVRVWNKFKIDFSFCRCVLLRAEKCRQFDWLLLLWPERKRYSFAHLMLTKCMRHKCCVNNVHPFSHLEQMVPVSRKSITFIEIYTNIKRVKNGWWKTFTFDLTANSHWLLWLHAAIHFQVWGFTKPPPSFVSYQPFLLVFLCRLCIIRLVSGVMMR